MSLSRHLPRILFGLLVLLALLPAGPRAQTPSNATEPPLAVLVTSGGDDQEVRVTLAFSRRVDYRLEESRNRLRIVLEEPLDERALSDVELGGEILRRIRFDSGKRTSQIVFHMGADFGSFDLSEQDRPFRLLVVFRKPGGGAGALPPQPGAAGPEGETGPDAQEPGAASGQDSAALPVPLPGRLPAHRPDEILNVVLDPGHGGQEEGAVGPRGLKEKDVVLDIARRVRQALSARGYNVALTREEDRAVGLDSRTAMANYLGADLFVSIHANASQRRGARGAESYFLSWDGIDEESLALAGVENRAPARAPEGSSGGDASGQVEAILWEMAQARHLGQSSRVATMMQEELNRATSIPDRGVKQAPFRVLVGATMPAILVEVGFLTHKEEEANLSQDDYRGRLADAMVAAIERFREATRREERGDGAAQQPGGASR